MRPVGRCCGTASTAEPGLGLAGAYLTPFRTRGQEGQAVWDAIAQSHAAGSGVTCLPCDSSPLCLGCERASVSQVVSRVVGLGRGTLRYTAAPGTLPPYPAQPLGAL